MRGFLCLLVCLLVCGCASMTNTQVDEPKLYGGTQLDIEAIEGGEYGPLPYFDLPLSFAIDTAMLPITLVNMAVRTRSEKDREATVEPDPTERPQAGE